MGQSDVGLPAGIDVGFLRVQAYAWTFVLCRVRDGDPGYLAKIVSCEPGKPRLRAIMGYLPFFEVIAQAERRRRGLSRAHDRRVEVVKVAVVLPEKLEHARQLLRGKKGWILMPPEPPRPEIWERLKRARSVAEVRQTARDLHERNRMISAPQWEAFHSHAEDLLRAKKLHNYPKSNRPHSDDKRIHFFAKVLAGLMQGIAPATATKRLARLPLPNSHDIRRDLENYAESFWEAHRKEKGNEKPGHL